LFVVAIGAHAVYLRLYLRSLQHIYKREKKKRKEKTTKARAELFFCLPGL